MYDSSGVTGIESESTPEEAATSRRRSFARRTIPSAASVPGSSSSDSEASTKVCGGGLEISTHDGSMG